MRLMSMYEASSFNSTTKVVQSNAKYDVHAVHSYQVDWSRRTIRWKEFSNLRQLNRRIIFTCSFDLELVVDVFIFLCWNFYGIPLKQLKTIIDIYPFLRRWRKLACELNSSSFIISYFLDLTHLFNEHRKRYRTHMHTYTHTQEEIQIKMEWSKSTSFLTKKTNTKNVNWTSARHWIDDGAKSWIYRSNKIKE